MTDRLKQFLPFLLAGIIGHLLAYKIVNIPMQIEVILISGLLLFYPLIRKPIIGIYAIFIISPFISYTRRLYYLIYSRPDSDPLIILPDLLLFFTMAGLFFELKEKKEQGWLSSKFTSVIFFYFIYMLIRTFFLNILPIDVAALKFKYYGPPVLFFFAGLVFGNSFKDIKRLWFLTIFIGLTSSLYAIKQLHFGYSEAETIWFSSIEFSTLFIKDIARPFSFFQAPVVLADYLQLTFIALLMAFSWINKKYRFLFLIPIPFITYAVLITSVRSSWMGLIITLILWILFFFLKTSRQRAITMFFLAAAYLSYNFITDHSTAIKTETTLTVLTSHLSKNSENLNLLVADRASAIYNVLNEHSIMSRFNLWRELLIYTKDPMHAILGRGVGALKADSLYFTYLAEFGYPGMIFIILFLSSLIITGFKIIDTTKNRDVKILISGITIMNIVFAVISLTGTHIHYSPSDIYFWFFNGVLVHYSIKMNNEKKNIQLEDNIN